MLDIVLVICSWRVERGKRPRGFCPRGFYGEFDSDFYGGELRANAVSFGSAGKGPNGLMVANFWEESNTESDNTESDDARTRERRPWARE